MNKNDLRSRVTDPGEWELIEESIVCLNSGALRAAYIMAWIAGVETLCKRLSFLAQGDGTVGDKLNQIKESKISVDQKLLDLAKEQLLISETEHTKLHAIKEHRNKLAHPGSTPPKAFEVEQAIESVVHYIAARPPQYSHSAAKNLVTGLESGRMNSYTDPENLLLWVEQYKDIIHPAARKTFLRECLNKFKETDKLFDSVKYLVVARGMMSHWGREGTPVDKKFLDNVFENDFAFFRSTFVSEGAWSVIPISLWSGIIEHMFKPTEEEKAYSYFLKDNFLDLIYSPSFSDQGVKTAVSKKIENSSLKSLVDSRLNRPPFGLIYGRVMDNLNSVNDIEHLPALDLIASSTASSSAGLTNEEVEDLALKLVCLYRSLDSYSDFRMPYEAAFDDMMSSGLEAKDRISVRVLHHLGVEV